MVCVGSLETKKRKRETSSEGESGLLITDSSGCTEGDGCSQHTIPVEISQWKEEHLRTLSIVTCYQQTTTPSDLLVKRFTYCLSHLFWFSFFGFFSMKSCTDALNINISQLKPTLS